MEQSLTFLTYKGSIPEAITEAKKQRKLFVVYISGGRLSSKVLHLKKALMPPIFLQYVTFYIKTIILYSFRSWPAELLQFFLNVHENLNQLEEKYIFSRDPQKSVPSITAIGYNGVQLWQNEGFLSAEALASSLEKACLGLHIQETTATVLSAALASNKSEPSTSGVSNTVSTDEETSSSKSDISNQGSSSSTVVESPLIDTNVRSPDAIDAASDTLKKNKDHNCTIEKGNDFGYKTFSESFNANGLECVRHEQPNSPTKSAQGVQDVAIDELNKSGGEIDSPVAEGGYSGPEKTTVNHSGVSGEGSQAFSNVKNEVVQVEKGEVKDDKVDTFENCTRLNRSSDVHLNIRLPNGVSLKQKLPITSAMRMVKDSVDENQGSGIGNYDLAIPYPRKIFCDQDLSKSLLDLGLFDRQALIAVPHQKGTSYLSGTSAFSDQTDSRNIVSSSDGSNGGYFSYVKRFLSFFNPPPYFGGGASSSSSGQQSENGTWEYRPNPTLRNNATQNTSSSGKNEGTKSRQPPASGFGSNIHISKHDKDD